MRRFVLGMILAVLLCGPAVAQKTTVGFITGASGLGDLSFNDMAYGGIRRAQQEFGFQLVVRTLPVDDSLVGTGILDLVEQSDIILTLGAQHLRFIKEVARSYPHKLFIVIEIPVEGVPNISSVVFDQCQGSFLAGYLAGKMTRTGTVGFVGGVPMPAVRQFEKGYRRGVAHADPSVRLIVDYVSMEGDYSGFDNPARGFELATAQYLSGADIVFAVAGLTGNGVIEAARRTGNFTIGVDSDQDSLAKGRVLTSMIKRLDVAAYRELAKALSGTFRPGVTRYGLGDGGVGLSDMRYTRHLIPKEVLKGLEQARRDVINGKIDLSPDGAACGGGAGPAAGE